MIDEIEILLVLIAHAFYILSSQKILLTTIAMKHHYIFIGCRNCCDCFIRPQLIVLYALQLPINCRLS